MKRLNLLLEIALVLGVLWLCSPAMAQETSVGVRALWHDAGAYGYSPAVGVGVEGNLKTLGERVTLQGYVESNAERKTYYDSGRTFRAQALARYRPFGESRSLVQPHAVGGYYHSRTFTPEWTKAGHSPFAGGGVTVRNPLTRSDMLIVEFQNVFQEKETFNEVKTLRWSAELYYDWPGKRWLVLLGYKGDRSTFYHPPCACRIAAKGSTIYAGAGWKF